jgi:hypothetical protein
MRRRRNPHDLRCGPQQIDLFAPVERGEAEKAPGWLDLPTEARQKLTRLMARLILDHAGSEVRVRAEGGAP